jgi:nucleoside-diphosphate-sugar epimerase
MIDFRYPRSMTRRRVMVTGATGYLGGAVARVFLDAGYALSALVRDPGRVDPALRTRDGFGMVRGDLLDPRSLLAAMDGCDAVVHCAGLVTAWHPDPDAFRRDNVTGTENVLEGKARGAA